MTTLQPILDAYVKSTGRLYGRWRVIQFSFRKGSFDYYLCRCSCGTERNVLWYSLESGHSLSCGCLQKEKASKWNTTHGETKRMEYSREIRAWYSMRKRCHNKNSWDWKHYGGRGITICQRWLDSFDNFLADMGRCPPRLQLERRDNEKGYSPENCYWATKITQANNTRFNRYISHDGETHTMAEWARIKAIPYT